MHLLLRLKNSGQIPNTLSWIRMGLFWLPGLLILKDPDSWWGFVTFVLIVATDKLDGILARRWNQTSKLGQIIDPLADKFLVVTVVVALCLTGILVSPYGWIFLAINMVREVGVTGLRWWRKRGESNLVIPADDDGKRKMFLQAVGVGLALVPVSTWGWPTLTDWWPFFIWAPLIMSLFYSVRSGIHYLNAK
jgi:Phosphatidylglycerophosphate synthase